MYDRDFWLCTNLNLVWYSSLGTSDPYVKCMLDQEKLFQTRVISKNINPKWDESFDYFLDNPFKPLTFQVMKSTQWERNLFLLILVLVNCINSSYLYLTNRFVSFFLRFLITISLGATITWVKQMWNSWTWNLGSKLFWINDDIRKYIPSPPFFFLGRISRPATFHAAVALGVGLDPGLDYRPSSSLF